MSDLDHRFEGHDGKKFRVSLDPDGVPLLFEWEDDSWWSGVNLARRGRSVLAELARLATARDKDATVEACPGGSRGFDANGYHWRISLLRSNGCPQIFKLNDHGSFVAVDLGDSSRPDVDVLCREFAALGREQERAESEPLLVQARDEAARLREESRRNAGAYATTNTRLVEERDRWRNNYNAENHDLIAARERIAELEARAAAIRAGEVSPLTARIAVLEHQEAGSRAEVDDLLARVEAQWTRAEAEKARADGYQDAFVKAGAGLEARARTIETLRRVAAEKEDFRQRSAKRWGDSIEAMRRERNEATERARLSESREASLREEQSRARTEGDPRRIVTLNFDAEGCLWATAADGSAWWSAGLPGLNDYAWAQVPPLPVVAEERAREAGGPEDAPEAGEAYPSVAIGDWDRMRVDVSRYGVALPGEADAVCKSCSFWAASHGDICAKCFADLGDSK